MENCCISCSHWQETDDMNWDTRNAGMRICTAITEGWAIADAAGERYAEGNEEGYLTARNVALREAKAVVYDGSEYMAFLATTPDFGCALFKAADSTTAPAAQPPR